MSNLLTASRLQSYRRCARLEWLQYVEGWRTVATADALAFGSLWHTGLEAWGIALMHGEPPLALSHALDAIAGKADDAFTQVKCEELLRGYSAKWIDQPYRVVGVEDEFRCPLINAATMQPSRTWELAGKIDARLETLEATPRRLIEEHKTTSEDISPASDYWIKLQMNHQLSIYMLGAESLGWPPDGCLYDVVRKPTIRPYKATPEESRKYTKDGRLYANQREQDETPDEFRLRLRADIESDPEAYYQRREIPRTESQLAEFLSDCWAQAKGMRESHLAGRAARNPEACHATGYGPCPYWDHCSAGVRLEDYPTKYRRLAFPHPELSLPPSEAA